MKKIKALVLLSGGLDSILAAKILKNQGIRITALCLKSCFFSDKKARIAAKKLGIILKSVDFSKEHLKMTKNPIYGYGSAINPCIDCHILMLKKAKEIMDKEGFDFVATGEGLGERPMSQNKRALDLIERKSGLSGYLLRPLSARIFEVTIPEKKKIVSRKDLFYVSGRSRKTQIALAKKWKIDWYPGPSGGCLLTEKEFGKKIRELSAICPDFDEKDARLLAFGRHLLTGKTKIIVGRNDRENKEIRRLAREGDSLIEMKNYAGPTTLVRGYSRKGISKKIIKKAEFLTSYYSTKSRGKMGVKFKIDFF